MSVDESSVVVSHNFKVMRMEHLADFLQDKIAGEEIWLAERSTNQCDYNLVQDSFRAIGSTMGIMVSWCHGFVFSLGKGKYRMVWAISVAG